MSSIRSWPKRLKEKIKVLLARYWFILMLIIFFGDGFQRGSFKYWWIPLAFITGVLLWRLWMSRDMFMMLMRQLETILYGKPLDKHYWTKDQWKGRFKQIPKQMKKLKEEIRE